MCLIAQTRKKRIVERALNLYNDLKSIQRNLQYGDMGDAGSGANDTEGAEHKKPKPLSQKELTKLRKAKISAETMAIGNKVRDLVDRETQRALTPRELKKIRKARMNIKHEREVMMAVPVAEYMSASPSRAKGTKHKVSKSLQNTSYQIQISEISSSLPHTTAQDNVRREQLIHFP